MRGHPCTDGPSEIATRTIPDPKEIAVNDYPETLWERLVRERMARGAR